MSTITDYLNLHEQIIPSGKKNRPGSRIVPRSITLHNTDNTNKGAHAKAHANFVANTGYYMWKGKPNWVSWHYTVDDIGVFKHLPVNEVSYHAGREANNTSIAIETCMNSDINQAEADKRLAHLVAVLMHDTGIGIDKIFPHKHWTGKNCPSLLLENWTGLIARINEVRKAIGNMDEPIILSRSELMHNLARKLELDDPNIDNDIDHHELYNAVNIDGIS